MTMYAIRVLHRVGTIQGYKGKQATRHSLHYRGALGNMVGIWIIARAILHNQRREQ